MKRQKNVEDISKEQLQKQLKPIGNDIDIANKKKLRFLDRLSLETKEMFDEIKGLDKKKWLYQAYLCAYKWKDLWY